MPPSDSIEGSGYPLCFKVRAGSGRPRVLGTGPGRETYVTEARQLAGHQKEAIVTEGGEASAWRMTSDEGKHLKGTDLAPFPLGFFNAGLHADLSGRIIALARQRGITVEDLSIDLQNGYWMTGSFFRGDGEGFAEPATTTVKLRSTADAGAVTTLVNDAVAASPALAAMRTPLINTFALYVNGRRRPIETMTASTAGDAPDPFMTHSTPPKPMAASNPLDNLITKTGELRGGTIEPAPAGTTTRIIRKIGGISHLIDPAGATETDTVLQLPGMTHFALKSDERPVPAPQGDRAPSGLALLSAGVAFCFMTQLSRYIEHMKFDINGVRLVQYSPYSLEADGGRASGRVGPVDTHLFLNGHAEEGTFEQLMRIAARTCYLHATLATALPTDVSVELNGTAI